jgi:hypothetical protein
MVRSVNRSRSFWYRARRSSSGRKGTIWSYVVYHRAFHPGFASELPYVVAIVENADGVRYTGRVIGRREDVSVGAKVRVVFADETPEFTLVKWELA